MITWMLPQALRSILTFGDKEEEIENRKWKGG
jgi:hypothetical protein